DLALPGALSQLGAVVALNGQLVTQLSGAGTSAAFTAASGTYQVFALASTATMGSYAVAVTPQSGPPAISLARAVSAPGGAVHAYSYDATITNAQSYNLNFVDFGVPNPFANVKAAVVQLGTVLGTPLQAAGAAGVTAAAGPVSVLVFAQSAASGGLFDVD